MAESGISASLVLTDSDGEREFALTPGYTWTIGRNSRSDIVVADNRASRDHAVIQRTDSGEYYLIDMGSLNGSYVNATRVSTPALLKNGDRVSIGGTVFQFRATDPGWASISGEMSAMDATQAWFVRRLMTVLVVDMRDFTGLTQRIDEALLCQTIGTFFRRAGETARKQGAWALKYIGDAVMAVWQHPEDGGEFREVVRVLRTALDFARIAADLEAKFRLPVPLQIGAGINTGLASVGNTGTGSIADYTALGDAVNAAFRMESATKETHTDVVMGQGTYEVLAGASAPPFRPRTVTLKGYEKPVEVWCADFDEVETYLGGLELTSSRPAAGKT